MWPETGDKPTEIECLSCGYVTTFVATVTRSAEEPPPRDLSLVDRGHRSRTAGPFQRR
jgi:hypothetical protein